MSNFIEVLRRRIFKGVTEYLFDASFDTVITIRRLDENMDEITSLTILEFPDENTNDAVVEPPTNSCYFRTGNNTSSVYVNDDDTPEEGAGITYLEIRVANISCRASVDSAANIANLMAADHNASDGVREMFVERLDIDTVAGCLAAAEALRDEFEKIPVTVTCPTLLDDLDLFDEIEYTSPRDGNIYTLVVTQIEQSLFANQFRYNYTLQLVITKTAEERRQDVFRRLKNPPRERKTLIDPDYVLV